MPRAPRRPRRPPSRQPPNRSPRSFPDVLARVNGETITRKEVEDVITNMEGRAGGPLPAEQRDQVYRGVIDQMVGYKLLLQEAKARKVNVADTEVEARSTKSRSSSHPKICSCRRSSAGS